MAEERDMTGWSEMERELGMTFSEGIIRACREVKAMREGHKAEKSIDDFFIEMDAMIADELAKENQHGNRNDGVLRG